MHNHIRACCGTPSDYPHARDCRAIPPARGSGGPYPLREPCSRDDDPSEHDRPRGGWVARAQSGTLPPMAHGARAYARS